MSGYTIEIYWEGEETKRIFVDNKDEVINYLLDELRVWHRYSAIHEVKKGRVTE